MTSGVDYLPKKPLSFPCSLVKVFDLRTQSLLPYSQQFAPNPVSLQLFDESRSAFLVTSLFGASAVYSLQSGLVELQQASVRRAAFVSPVVRRSRERGDHRLGAQRVARRALRRLPPRRPPPLRAAPRLAGRSSLSLPSSQLSARGRPYPSPAGHAALPLALDSAPLGLLASRFPVSTPLASALASFPEDRVDVPRTRRVLDCAVGFAERFIVRRWSPIARAVCAGSSNCRCASCPTRFSPARAISSARSIRADSRALGRAEAQPVEPAAGRSRRGARGRRPRRSPRNCASKRCG